MMDYFALGLASLTGIIWAVRQEGRLNRHDTLFEERQNSQDDRDRDIKDRLVRIEQKLDQQHPVHRS